ncbi:uncharacterized protein GGS22DRAFT_196075 [Annulohypoxylon maeteangense]|uniref:uncharacterized protein n=1 Tax=Annulohypoxylon maeteangense TaxID=1927788 RepID=UPI002007E7A0|nr:uncharacterized protein GGS22DRAFT_196075 [Annulohypoxylon maeteangense]KAI0881889.1 hypothetical protein GGS22DRAFT_196075 [Annulohypoxylon maeteangense]
MATVLGKRKVRPRKEESSINQEDAQAIFRRHFEAQFAPLEQTQPIPRTVQASELEDLRSDSDDASDGSWDGLSGEGSDDELENSSPSTSVAEIVEVVSHTNVLPALSNDPLSKRESKAYLSSRIPSSLLDSSSSTTISTKKRKTTTDEDAPSLLKNDLALQRLLSESHLFSKSGHNEGSTEHAGRNRHIATDIRLSSLGSKASIYKQQKMPMAHRKGITAAATSRESKRRKEARENGIILERPISGASKGNTKMRRREKAVDAPAVGRLRNGMLKLSQKDITEIQGHDRRSGGKGGGKRRRR